MEKHVAVVSSDRGDFENWMNKMKLDGKPLRAPRQMSVGDTVYHCVYKPTHLISLTFDSIVEADNARKNDAYASIITLAKTHLKPDDQLKLNFDE